VEARDFLSWRGARGLTQDPALFCCIAPPSARIPPPPGAIGAPGPRLPGGVPGAGHRRERWDVTPRGAIVEGDREPVPPVACQGAEAYL